MRSSEMTNRLGTELLALVLDRLPNLQIEPAQVELLVQFFSSRLSDFPSIPSCIKGLRALIVTHYKPNAPIVGRDEVAGVVQLIFEEIPMRALPVAVRGNYSI